MACLESYHKKYLIHFSHHLSGWFFHDAGVVRVYYDVKMGFPSTLDNMDAILAIGDFDFRSVVRGDIIMYEGDVSASVPVVIFDDNVPEIDELFLVELTSVELVSPLESTFSPELGKLGDMSNY